MTGPLGEGSPDPQLTDEHAAVVEPLAVARCDLDGPMVERGLFPAPYPVGHELAGRIVAVGRQVTRHAVGETVIVPFQISCGRCGPCQAGTFAATTIRPWDQAADVWLEPATKLIIER